jgi:hypothetical protein
MWRQDPTVTQIAGIEETMRGVFGFDHDVHERLAHARFIAGRAQSFEQAAKLFADLFNKRLTAEERGELVGLVEKIARVDGPTAAQTADIDVLKRLVGLPLQCESALHCHCERSEAIQRGKEKSWIASSLRFSQ